MTVRVIDDPEFSAIDVALEVKVTVGVVSSSVIVMVTACDPFSVADPPETVEIATIPVSLPSKVLSSVGVNEVVPVVDPAVIVISEIVP